MRYFHALLLLLLLFQVTTEQCTSLSQKDCGLNKACAFYNSQCVPFTNCSAYESTSDQTCFLIHSSCAYDRTGRSPPDVSSCRIRKTCDELDKSECVPSTVAYDSDKCVLIGNQCMQGGTCPAFDNQQNCQNYQYTMCTWKSNQCIPKTCSTLDKASCTYGSDGRCIWKWNSCQQAKCSVYDDESNCLTQGSAEGLCAWKSNKCMRKTCSTSVLLQQNCENSNAMDGPCLFKSNSCVPKTCSASDSQANCPYSASGGLCVWKQLTSSCMLKSCSSYDYEYDCLKGQDGGCVWKNTQCILKTCSILDNQSDCQNKLYGRCAWKTNICMLKTCSAFDNQSDCNQSDCVIGVDGNCVWTSSCIVKQNCSQYGKQSDCLTGVDGDCVWTTSCILKQTCISYGKQSDCVTGIDGNCVWASSCIMKKTCALYGKQSDCVSGTDGDCGWANGACIKKQPCYSYTQQNCVIGTDGTCVWKTDSCMLKTCYTYATEQDCVTPVDGNCIWASSCIMKKTCAQYSNQSDCVTGTDGNCVWAYTSCIKKMPCASYDPSQCVIGTDGRCATVRNSVSQSVSCVIRTSSIYEEEGYCTNNGYNWINGVCRDRQRCVFYTSDQCLIGTDGTCIWQSNQCNIRQCSSYASYECSSDQFCVLANQVCIRIGLCASYNQQNCIQGTDGKCVWKTNTCMLQTCSTYANQQDCGRGADGTCVWASSCILLKSCPLYRNKSDCVTGTSGDCAWANVACIKKDVCASYPQENCVTGTDGPCVWKKNQCMLVLCPRYTNQSDCVAGFDHDCVWASSCILKKTCALYYNQADCVTGTDGECAWANGACIKKVLCSSYPQSNCVIGTDGSCVWKKNSCMLNPCSTYSNQSDCVAGFDGDCAWASSCILKTTCALYVKQSDCVSGTDGDCAWANGTCIKKDLCANYPQQNCVIGTDGNCVWQMNSCTLKTCSTYANQADCITGVDGDCVWASSCILKKNCALYLKQSDCVLGTDGDCAWANGTCIKKDLCVNYPQQNCVIGTDGNCVWKQNSCMLKTCSTYGTQSDCVTGVDVNCVWASSCILKKNCALYLKQSDCGIGVDGNCFWANSCILKQPCALYIKQSDCVTGTDGDCVLANGTCIKKEACNLYKDQSKCVNGIEGPCLWQNNTCGISKLCSEYNLQALCVTGADGHCLWKNNSCYLQRNCSQYDNQQTCFTGTDGTCLWKDAVCFLQQNCSQYNQQYTCFSGTDGACLWRNNMCLLLQACSNYTTQQTCFTGTDGPCLWGGTFCMLIKTCQNYYNQQTCLTGTDGNCIWLTNNCILKQACSNYDNYQNCVTGTDGQCAWLQKQGTCKLAYCINSIDPPATCQCQNGYFNSCAEQCQRQCQTCKSASDVCLTCNTDYINPPACIQQCSQADSSAQFTDDLNNIIIKVRKLIQQTITCSGLFDQKTLLSMGTNCICTINPDFAIQITLGSNATIRPNSKLVFQASYLYLANCTTPLTDIQSPTVAQPNIIITPSITFDNNPYRATQCDDLTINIIAQTNNGQNVMTYQKWTIISADDATLIQPLILVWNSNISVNSYIIPSKYLSGQKNIILSLMFNNFIGTQSSQQITIIVQEQTLNYVMLPRKARIQYYNRIKELNIIDSINITNQSRSLLYIVIPDCLIIISTLLSDQQVEKLNIPFQLVLEDLKVSILGGDQSVSMNSLVNLTGTIIDPNIQNAVDLSKYQIEWLCQDSSINSFCQGTNYTALQFQVNVTNKQAHTNLQITLKVSPQNSSKSYATTINLTIVEDVVIPMIMTGNQCSLNSRFNLNDKLNITVQILNPSINTSQIQGQLAYLKEGQYQPFMQFSYMSFLVDINNLYTQSKLENVKLQATVQLSQYKNPSTATINIMINIPPQKCQLKISPRLNQYNLQVFGCVTANPPLEYQFIQYKSAQDFDYDSNVGFISKGVILSDFRIQAKFITYLSASKTSLIVAVIKDSFAAQSNTSLSLTEFQINNQLNYAEMLSDDKQNIQRNIFMILTDNEQNQRSMNKQEIDQIDLILESGNQTDPLVLKNQIMYQKIYGVTPTKLVSKMNTSKTVAISLSEKANSLQIAQDLNQINPTYQQSIREIYQTANNLGDYMSSLYIQSQSVKSNNNTTNDTNTTTNFNSQLIEGAQTLTNILTDLTSVNQGPVNISTESFVLSSQKMTGLAANTYFGAEVINANQVVSFSRQEFITNPYENQSDFVNPVKAPLIIPSLTDLAKKQVIPQKPVPFSFKVIKDVKVDCASKINDRWSLGICKLIESTVIECLCETLSPLSLLQAAIFIASSFKALFEREILSKINGFPYFEALFTYIIATFVVIFFIGKYLLHRIDVIRSLRVGPVSICNSIEMMEQQQIPDSIGGLRLQKSYKKILQTVELPLYTQQSLIGQVNDRAITKVQGFIQFLKYSHPLFSIYWLDDAEEPRILRVTVLFLGMFGKICIFVLFGRNLAISIIIVLSICQTVYGISFSFLLSLMMKAKNAHVNKLGVFIAVILTLFQSYMIIASLALYSSASQANTAALSYLASFVTDYFVTNIIFGLLIFTIILRTYNSRVAHKLFQKLLPVGLQEVLFGKQAPSRPTALEVGS